VAGSQLMTDSPSRNDEPIAVARLPSFSVKAVLMGLAVDIGGTMVGILLIGVVAAVAMNTRGASTKELEWQLTQSSAIQVFYAASGLFMSVMGGYVAARLAAFAHLRHGLLTGLVSSALSLASLSIPQENSGSLWLGALVSLAAVPCATLGGYLASPRLITEEEPEEESW